MQLPCGRAPEPVQAHHNGAACSPVGSPGIASRVPGCEKSTGRVEPMKNWRTRGLGVLAVLLVAGVATAAGGQLASARTAKHPAPPTGTCNFANGIKHVIYVQFDNTHLLRDNPNVPSDLEQMPNLLNFMKNNGTLLTNDHTILISHTGGGILSTLTGLYPDRHGQAVSNSYGYFRPDGSVGFSSSFKYWTDQTDGGNPVPPAVPSADPNYNMVNNDSTALGGNN